jgi:hypothetical protein
MKRIILIFVFGLPISILIFLVADSIMGSVMGGIATTKGFPIPYYRDVWTTPQVDYYIPLIKYIDIALIYTAITFVGLKLSKK